MNEIFSGVLYPTFVVRTKDSEYFHLEANRAEIDTENKIVKFIKHGSVDAMFQLDDASAFWRII